MSEEGAGPGTKLNFPGTKLEKAAADVSSAAGKSLVKGLANLFGASFSEYLARKKARAKAIEVEISTASEINRENELVATRREREISELQHQSAIELAKRRAERMLREMAREQENLETISTKSIAHLENDPSSSPGDLDEEWLFRFAEHAQKISESTLQEIWARILASAATTSRPQVSAATLFMFGLHPVPKTPS